MQLDNVRVARKLWGAFIILMIAMVILSGFAQNRANTAMASAIDEVVEIEGRISTAIRWRGSTETAVNMVVGSTITTDTALAQQYDARVQQIIASISKLQEQVTAAATTPEEKAAIEKVAAERKAVLATTAKTGQVKAAGDAAATQRYVDGELMPMVARYLQAQDDFVKVLEQRREAIRAQATAKRVEYAIWGIVTSLLIVAVGLFMAWRLVHSIKDPLDQTVALAEAIAAGDLTRELQTARKDEFGDMLRALGAMTQRLRNVVTEVRSGVDSVSSASVEIANGNHDLSARTEQTASNLEETAASMEELTATVTQSADTARQANQLASTAAQAAARGGEVVGQVVTSMQHITDSSRKISDIIGVIDGIAFQTNILALNAAVEAARAGEQGRGFAVVAGEVRTLAQRSADAAKEIKTLINKSVENVDSGSAQVAQAGQAMEEIVSSVRRVSDLIGEITASSVEQRDGIAQVNQAVSHLDQMTQQNAALVEESTAAAASMRDQAQRLAEVVSMFNVGAAAATPRPAAAPRPAQRAASPAALRASAPAPARSPAAAPAARIGQSASAPRPAPAPAPKGGDDEWESF